MVEENKSKRKMRGGGQKTGGGRGRGRGDTHARNCSPSPSNIRDHRSGSGYRNNSSLPHRPSHPTLRPPPADRRFPHRSPVVQTSSNERQGERDYAVRRSEHGMHRTTSFRDEVIDFQHNYLLPDHPTDLSDVHAPLKSSLKSSGTMRDKDLAGSSSGLDSRGMLVQESLFLDDGSKRTFYTLPQDSGHPFDLVALGLSENMRSIGSGSGLNPGMPRLDQLLSDSYGDKEMEKFYTRDVSFSAMAPPSLARPYGSTLSSSLSKDLDLLRSYGDRGGVGKFLDDPLKYNGHNQSQLSDRVRRAPVIPPVRKEPLDYGYNELGRRRRDDEDLLPSDGPYRKMVYGPRGAYRDADVSSFLDPAGRRIDRDEAYCKKFNEGSPWDEHYSLREAMNFRDQKGVHEDYVGSSGGGYAEFGLKASPDHEFTPFEERDHFGRDVAAVPYRERPNSPLLVDHPFDMSRHGVSSPREKSRGVADFDTSDRSSGRMLRRNYVMAADLIGRNVHRRLQSPINGDEMWSNEEEYRSFEEEYRSFEESRKCLPPKKLVTGQSQYKLPSRKMSRNDGQGLSSDSSARVEGVRRTSLKKRLRPGPSDFHGAFALERRQEFFRPHKIWKRGQEDRDGSLNAPDGDVQVDAARCMKKDPQEDSEEFKQQVHKAFLLFSKLLNETPHQQKRFRDDQAKSTKLFCCVCGSHFPKEFVDIHSLLTHSYRSLKAGLRTDHLGFHKALCVLNGWNWRVAPDPSQAYRQRIPSEIKALKEDLILWPPIVIIHNSSIENKSKSNGLRVVSIENLKEILTEMGFGAGKTLVGRGKPANQSVLLVKFMPTLSGLQEAERLHKYHADNNRGRLGFLQITSNNDSGGETRVEKDEELLYGYMAVAEDLDKLDPETKKRSLVKSKKDIEAIADAPLKID